MNDNSLILPWHEQQLKAVTLFLQRWAPVDGWDHEHCAFCWAKFAVARNCLRVGYATADGRHWICPDCFAELHDRFGWRVQEDTSACMEVDGA